MVEIIAPGSFRTAPIEPPKSQTSRLPRPDVPLPFPNPVLGRGQENEQQEKIEKLKRLERYARYANLAGIKAPTQPQQSADTEAQQVLSEDVSAYEIGLSDEDIQKLEEAAAKVGLSVPESLKQKRVVSPEEKDEALAEMQKQLDDFLQDLNEAYAKLDYQNMMRELRGMAEVYRAKHPFSHVFINDAGFMVAIDPTVRRSAPKLPSLNDVDVDLNTLTAKAEQDLNNPYAGYEEYYKGLYALNRALGLGSDGTVHVDVDPSKFSNPRARSRGLHISTDVDMTPEEAEPPKLYFDETKTWADIQRENEAMREIYTATNIASEALHLPDYEPDDSGLERFAKGIPRGMIGFFLWPVDLAMAAGQWDKIYAAAVQEDKSASEFLKENAISALKDPATWGEITGSLAMGGIVSAARNAFTTRVIETPLTTTGSRELSKVISTPADDLFKFTQVSDDLYRASVNLNPTDDFMRVSSSEFFKLDELHRVTVRKTPFSRSIRVEKVPQTFDYMHYRGLLGNDYYAGRSAMLRVQMDSGQAALTLSEIVQKNTDDLVSSITREAQVDPADVLKFVEDAKGQSGPSLLIDTTRYSADDLLSARAVVGVTDDGSLRTLKLDVGPYTVKDVLDDMTRRFNQIPSAEELKIQANLMDELTESGNLVSEDYSKFFVKDKAMADLARATKAEQRGLLDFDRPIRIMARELSDDMAKATAGTADDTTKLLQLPANEELLDQAPWKVSVQASGPAQEVVIRPPRWIGAPADLSTIDLTRELDREKNLVNDAMKQLSGQGQDLDLDYRLDYDMKTVILEMQREMQDLGVSLKVSEITRPRVRPEQKVSEKTDLDLSIDLSYDLDLDMNIRQEMRQAQALLTMTLEPEPPKPRIKKTKIKPKPKKRINATPKKPKKKSSKKRKKEKGGEWGVWIGYESLFEGL